MEPMVETKGRSKEEENLVPEKDISEPQKLITQNGTSESLQEKSSKSAADIIAFFTASKTNNGSTKVAKRKEKEISKSSLTIKNEETPKTSKQERKPERKSLSGSLNSEKKSWRKSLGLSGFSSREKKERRVSTLELKPGETISSAAKKVRLRDKKGRLAVEERKMKSRSLGDIDQKLKTLNEVSILDPSAPITRVVSTADIPDTVKTEDFLLLPKAPRVSDIASSTSISSDSPVRAVELGKPVEVHINLSPPTKETDSPVVKNESLEKDLNTESVTKKAESEDSALLQNGKEPSQRPVVITSPPHPMRLSMSEMDLSTTTSSSSLTRKSPGFSNKGESVVSHCLYVYSNMHASGKA